MKLTNCCRDVRLYSAEYVASEQSRPHPSWLSDTGYHAAACFCTDIHSVCELLTPSDSVLMQFWRYQSPWVNAVEAVKHTFYVKGSYFEHTIVTVYVWMGCSSSLYFFGNIYEKCWYLLHIFCQVVRQCSSGEVEDSMPDTCADTFWL